VSATEVSFTSLAARHRVAVDAALARIRRDAGSDALPSPAAVEKNVLWRRVSGGAQSGPAVVEQTPKI
jgi:hypothetical protein